MDSSAQEIGGGQRRFFAKPLRVIEPLKRIFYLLFKAGEYLHGWLLWSHSERCHEE
jgi:hypothetical protein